MVQLFVSIHFPFEAASCYITLFQNISNLRFFSVATLESQLSGCNMLPNMLQLHRRSGATGRKTVLVHLGHVAQESNHLRGSGESVIRTLSTCCICSLILPILPESPGIDLSWSGLNWAGKHRKRDWGTTSRKWCESVPQVDPLVQQHGATWRPQGSSSPQTWSANEATKMPRSTHWIHLNTDQAELVHATRPLCHKNHQNLTEWKFTVQSPSFCKHLLAATLNIERLEGVHCSMTSGEISEESNMATYGNMASPTCKPSFLSFLTISSLAKIVARGSPASRIPGDRGDLLDSRRSHNLKFKEWVPAIQATGRDSASGIWNVNVFGLRLGSAENKCDFFYDYAALCKKV